MKKVTANIEWSRILAVIAVVFGISSISPAADDIWTTKADMPTARTLLSTCVVAGRIYAIGGGPSPYTAFSVVEEYDPVTDSWTTKAEMSTKRFALGTCAVNGKIYAIGGVGSHTGPAFASVEEYDPQTDTWTTKSDMPTARGMFSTSAVNGKIYAIGGAQSTHGPVLSLVEAYNPATDTWTRMADLPETKYYHSASVVNGKIYVIGGAAREAAPSRTVYEYDPATNTHSRKADMPTATAMLSTCMLGGKIYAIGGDPSIVEEYNPETDTWAKKANMLTPRALLSSSVTNGKIYAFGGSTTVPGTALATVEEYDPNPLIVDFDGNGLVDIKDLEKLIECWGQTNLLVDIGPTPWGDGVVDKADLAVLMSHWGQEVDDPTLIACWKMDEIEGDVAYDSASTHDAIVVGGAEWQPGNGRVNGALQFDGIDDYVDTLFKLNPAEGVFSVFAWVNGGLPGQVILSQENGANWLTADAQGGTLRTDLSDPITQSRRGMSGGLSLISTILITDDNWHRVGLVWDGTDRILYADDVEVARGTLAGLASANGGLRIGVGSRLEPGSFWAGMIDDVRIYDRVVEP